MKFTKEMLIKKTVKELKEMVQRVAESTGIATNVNKLNKDQLVDLYLELANTLVPPEPATPQIGAATPRQITTYLAACERKGIEPDPLHTTWDKNTMSQKIQSVFAMQKVIPASKRQIEMILDLAKRCGLPTPKTEGLTTKSASNLITSLFKIEQKVIASKPSEKQLELLYDMMKCPDVEPLDDPTKLTREAASAYIERNRNTFSAWKYRQATESQKKFINDLLVAMGNPPLTDEALELFDKETASKYINQLRAELQDKGLSSGFNNEPTIDADVGRMLDKKAQDDKEYDNLVSAIHELYAAIGQEAEDELLNESNIAEEFTSLVRIVNSFVGMEAVKEILDKIFSEDEVEAIILGCA